jgi:hypothetical protein
MAWKESTWGGACGNIEGLFSLKLEGFILSLQV